MNKLKDALQKLDMKTSEESSETKQQHVNHNDDMPKQNRDGLYEITSKEQHA